MSESQFEVLDGLIERLRDGEPSEAERAELTSLLANEPGAQKRFARQMALSAALHRRKRGDQQKVVDFPKSDDRASRRWQSVVLGLAAAVVAALGTWLTLPHFQQTDPGSAPLARVSQLDGKARLDQAAVSGGDMIGRGALTIDAGSTMDLLFANGANLLLEGPAEVIIESDLRVALTRGQLAARIPEAAHGFTVLGPDAAVVDLGTEFSMAVDGDRSWVEVYEGEVDIVLLNEAGQAWKNQSLTPTGPVRIDAADGRIIEEAPAVELPRIVELPTKGLRVPKTYREAVRDDGARHYWRFEQADGGVVGDTLGEAEGVLEGGVRLHKRALFDAHGRKHHGACVVAEPDPTLFDGEFTLELWISPAFLQNATVLEVSHRDPASKFREKLHRISLTSSRQGSVYPRESVRFHSELWPHGGKGALNVFSEERYTPGDWHHVVAVRRSSRIEIYLNGALAQSADAPPTGGITLPTTITLGRMSGSRFPDSRPDRSHFKGFIDECAVYPLALSPEAVARHYRLMIEGR